LSALIQQLRCGYDIVYLLAHGRLLDGQTILYLEDAHGRTEPVDARVLVTRLAQLVNRPRLIVLGVCQSAGDEEADPALALGPCLARAGVPAVLAMQGCVTIETLQHFLPAFFRSIQDNGQVDRAVAIARSRVCDRPDFWSPVLFLRLANGRLWQDQEPRITVFQPIDGFGEAQVLCSKTFKGADTLTLPSKVLLRDSQSYPAPRWAVSPLVAQYRAELLCLLHMRYAERLGMVRSSQLQLQIGLYTRPDAVDPVWRRLHLRIPNPASAAVWDRSLTELFDTHGGQLLILGSPGGGKTTALIELASILVARAQASAQERIPVVLHLASWQNGQRLKDWLATVLPNALGISKRFATDLVSSGVLLLLLDGLDEVAVHHQAACVDAITRYLSDAELAPPLVVACRSQEYRTIGARLPLAAAVELAPLDVAAIERSLGNAADTRAVAALLRQDLLLRELVRTPLMLNVLLLTHGAQVELPCYRPDTLAHVQDPSPAAIHIELLEQRRDDLWVAYVRCMFQQRPIDRNKIGDALKWLRYLANMLDKQNMTDFLLDSLQCSCMSTKNHRKWYGVAKYVTCGIPSGLLGGVIISSLGCSLGLPITMFCFIVGFLLGIFLFYFSCYDRICREEQTRWSWAGFRISLKEKGYISLLLFFSLILGLVVGLPMGEHGFIVLSLVIFLISSICFIDRVIDAGWRVENLKVQKRPGMGITRSLYTGLARLLILLFVKGAIIFLVWNISDREILILLIVVVAKMIVWFSQGFYIGPSWGLVGIGAFLKHYTLRLVLAFARVFPFRAVTFLDSMCTRLLLERDGAVYRFRHILLRDFFANLTDMEIEQIAQQVCS
jgi:hypothetical protein